LLHFSLWTAAKFGISREMCRTVQKAPSAIRGTFPPALTAAEKKENPLGWWLCKYVFAPPKTPLKKNAESCRLHWGVQLEKKYVLCTSLVYIIPCTVLYIYDPSPKLPTVLQLLL